MKKLSLIFTQSCNRYLFLLIFSLASNSLHAQKNAIKVTPAKPVFGKINIGYERFLKKDWSLTTDFQLWFQDKIGEDKKFFGGSQKYNLKNQGLRSSLELRKYFNIKNTSEKRKNKINIAISAYVGKHHVETIKYRNGSSAFYLGESFGLEPSNSYVPPYYGTADIISSGIGIHLGYRIIWKSGIFINGEIIKRISWTNYGSSRYEISSGNSIIKTRFEPLMDGHSVEPLLSVGYMF